MCCAPGSDSNKAGILNSCAARGDGKRSITETSNAVESGSHAENTALSKALGSLDLIMCAGILMFKLFVIFSSSG
jgi:hypothetical protein